MSPPYRILKPADAIDILILSLLMKTSAVLWLYHKCLKRLTQFLNHCKHAVFILIVYRYINQLNFILISPDYYSLARFAK